MSKEKSSNVIVCVGDEDYNFNPRSRFSKRKTKLLNNEWNRKYNTSKIDIPSSVQNRFNDLYLFYQDAKIVRKSNVQRYEIDNINEIFVDIHDSIIESDKKWYKEFTQAIGRQEFHVKGFLTWSRDQFLELPGQTYVQRGNETRTKVSPIKCCYFSIDPHHDYYLQGWTKMDNRTMLNTPDLIRIKYRNMRIFPGDFIHGGGFKNTMAMDGCKNTRSCGNFRIQLLIVDDGHKKYKPLNYPTNIDYVNVTEKELSCYNFEEEIEDDDSNYNNSTVKKYTSSSLKSIEFCPVKKHTEIDLVVNSNCESNAKLMSPSYPDNNNLHVYKTSHSGTNLNKWPSINLNHEELIVEPSSSWEAGDFNELSQGNLSDKQKSKIWLSQSTPFNNSIPWSTPSNNVSQTQEERKKRKQRNMNWPRNNTLINKNNSKESINKFVTQSHKKVSKCVNEIKTIDLAIPILTRLDDIFNRCRKVPPTVKRILKDRTTNFSEYCCIYTNKENIVKIIELFNVTSAYYETTKRTFEMLTPMTIEKACFEWKSIINSQRSVKENMLKQAILNKCDELANKETKDDDDVDEHNYSPDDSPPYTPTVETHSSKLEGSKKTFTRSMSSLSRKRKNRERFSVNPLNAKNSELISIPHRSIIGPLQYEKAKLLLDFTSIPSMSQENTDVYPSNGFTQIRDETLENCNIVVDKETIHNMKSILITPSKSNNLICHNVPLTQPNEINNDNDMEIDTELTVHCNNNNV